MMFSLKMSKNAVEKLFSGTVFFAAALFFALSVFYAEKTMPLLSSAGNVFSVTVLFAALCALAGAVFIHFFKAVSEQRQAVLLGGFIFLSVFFMPVHLYGAFGGIPPVAAILKNLFLSAFIPFFILSWPFFLFGKFFENAKKTAFLTACGALVGICVYVWLCPDNIDFKTLSTVLTVLYGIFLAMFLVCVYFMYKKDGDAPEARTETADGFSFKNSGTAFLYGFIPVSLCLSVTQYIFINLYPIPTQYILPAVVVICAFLAAFSKISDLFLKLALFLQPFALALFFLIYLFSFVDVWLSLNLVVLAVFVLLCACLLAEKAGERKPFFAVSAVSGAVAAAAFNGVFAPYVTGWAFEYPLVIILGVAVRPGVLFANRSLHQIWQDFAYPLALFFLCFCAYFMTTNLPSPYQLMLEAAVFIIVGVLCLLRAYPLRYAMTSAVILVFGAYVFADSNKASVFIKKPVSLRNFYGSVSVSSEKLTDGAVFKLYMNDFLKGFQYRTAEKSDMPQKPYDKNGGVGKFFMTASEFYKNPSVGVIGLGTGALASYASGPYEDWRFFEPDADIAELATGYGAVFSYYRKNTPYAPVIIGEPVTNILREGRAYDILIVDTFAFKTFPLYLMSPDAFSVYLSHLKKGGTILFHTVAPYAVWGKVLNSVLRQLPAYAGIFRNPEFPESQWVAVTFDESILKQLRRRDKMWESLYMH